MGVVETTTNRYGVSMATNPKESAPPKGKREKANTELGFLCRSAFDVLSEYRPSMRVILTERATVPIPLVVRWENPIPLLSAEANTVYHIPRKPIWRMATSKVCLSAAGVRSLSTERIWRKGFAGLASS